MTRGNKYAEAGTTQTPEGDVLRARRYRRELRERLAAVETALGHRGTAELLRSCELGTWQWDFSEDEPAPIVDRSGRPIARSTYCDHRLCPRCCTRRACDNRDRMLPGVLDALRFDPDQTARERAENGPRYVSKGRRPVFMTLDQRARPDESLAATAERLMDAFQRLRRRCGWVDKVRGCLVSVEVTRNPIGRWWHVHMHVLADCDWYPQDELLAEWRDCLGPWPEDASKTPGGARIEPVDDVGEGIREVLKYLSKGLSSPKDNGETVALDAYDDAELTELVAWARGRRMSRTYGTFYGIKANEEGALDVEEPDQPPEWKEGENAIDPIVGINPLTGNLVRKSVATPLTDDQMTEGAWQWVLKLFKEARRRERASTGALIPGAPDTGPPDTGPPIEVAQ